MILKFKSCQTTAANKSNFLSFFSYSLTNFMNDHANVITATSNRNLLSSSNSSHHGIAAVKWKNTNVRWKYWRQTVLLTLFKRPGLPDNWVSSLPSSRKEADVVTMSCFSNEPQARNFTHPLSDGCIYNTASMGCNKTNTHLNVLKPLLLRRDCV